MSKKNSSDNLLLWLDLEMTGLDPDRCTIVEIGAMITDNRLRIVAEGPVIAVHHSDKVLFSMEPWSQRHHERSGLVAECCRSVISMKKAQSLILKFVKSYFPKETARLCGNSIWQDRRFLSRYMPALERYLHYRMVDVSSVKELIARWYPRNSKPPAKKSDPHRAAADIKESIKELAFYRKRFFRRT